MIDYMKASSISEFTKQEFLEFVKFLGTAPGETERENSRWNRKFRDIVQHPKGTDLLFYPESGKKTPQAMVEEVERHRRENGLPCFKDSDF